MVAAGPLLVSAGWDGDISFWWMSQSTAMTQVSGSSNGSPPESVVSGSCSHGTGPSFSSSTHPVGVKRKFANVSSLGPAVGRDEFGNAPDSDTSAASGSDSDSESDDTEFSIECVVTIASAHDNWITCLALYDSSHHGASALLALNSVPSDQCVGERGGHKNSCSSLNDMCIRGGVPSGLLLVSGAVWFYRCYNMARGRNSSFSV